MKMHAIVKFHELALKGRNRPTFIRMLSDNLRIATEDLEVEKVWKGQMMIGLALSSDDDWPSIRERVKNCFGVAKFFRAYMVAPSLGHVMEILVETLKDRSFKTFRITANRADKEFPLKSPEIQRELGTYVHEFTGASVDLKNPDLEVLVDVLPGNILVYFDEIQGYGGLPVGVSGNVLALLSGGIDSPVAAWQMMKRGCKVDFIHFHSYPLTDQSSIEKAVELANLLTKYQYSSKLFLVPFGDIQKRIVLSSPNPYRIILYRRFMVRIAQSLAQRERSEALVTGESLGQVSSQTLQNIAVIDHVSTIPILRPLVGSNKQEIIDSAQSIGTYPVSILPDQDCCTLFNPRNPATRGNLQIVNRLESLLPIEKMVQDTLNQVDVRTFHFPIKQGSE